ncbi:hypothetical protein [Solirubrobacter soli]|uniref:hypothetical protein n=1 Tax=Solirubrobacter soli TaxID=363832 RepID=UPI00040C8319|nr:hypothetical protein [Solirubrobacter soli]
MTIPGPVHQIRLELRFDGAAPTGQIRLEASDEPRAFSGWVGLVRAVEELVTETPEPVRSAT